MDADTAVIGAIRANEEPRYEGRRPAVIRKNSKVPIAVKKSVVDGGKPVNNGTRNVAPNIATTCCAPIPIVRGQDSRFAGKDDVARINRSAATVKLPTEQLGL